MGDRVHPRSAGPTTAIRSGRSIPTAPPSFSATPWPGKGTTSRPLRVHFPEYAQELDEIASFRRAACQVAADSRASCTTASVSTFPPSRKTPCRANWPTASPDASPTCYNFHGPNYVCDAACASAMAAIQLGGRKDWSQNDFDVAVTGGIDRNMGAPDLREVLQDRRPLGHRYSALCRRRRRLRHGRGRGDFLDEAAG